MLLNTTKGKVTLQGKYPINCYSLKIGTKGTHTISHQNTWGHVPLGKIMVTTKIPSLLVHIDINNT